LHIFHQSLSVQSMFRRSMNQCLYNIHRSSTRPAISCRSFTPRLRILPLSFPRIRLFSNSSGKNNSKKNNQEHNDNTINKTRQNKKKPEKEEKFKKINAKKQKKEPHNKKKESSQKNKIRVTGQNETKKQGTLKKRLKKEGKKKLDFHANITRMNSNLDHLDMKNPMNTQNETTINASVDNGPIQLIDATLHSCGVKKNDKQQSPNQILITQKDNVTDQDINDWFVALDTTFSGCINYNDFISALRCTDIDLQALSIAAHSNKSEEIMKNWLFKVADTNEDGVIDKSEFHNFIKKTRSQFPFPGHFFLETTNS